MKHYISLICILFGVLIGCSKSNREKYNYIQTNKNDNVFVVDLDNGEKKDTLFISSLFKSVKCIPLETSDQSIIGSINKLLVYKNFIFLLDSHKAKRLFVYDLDGHFLKNIGSRGPGPEEYIDISDFTIDTDKDEIIIFDYDKSCMLFYNLFSGKYIKSVYLSKTYLITTIQYVDNIIFADAHEFREDLPNYLLQSVNIETGNQENVFLKTNEHNKGWNELHRDLVNYFLPTIETPYLFRQIFMDTIFHLTNHGITPYIAIKSKDFITEKDLIKPENIEKFKFLLTLGQKNIISRIISFFQNNDYFYFQYFKGNKRFSVIYNTY